MFRSVLCVECQRVERVKILSSNPHTPRPLNWQSNGSLLNRGQKITAFLHLTSIFLTENSLDKQFGSASLWHIMPTAWLGHFGRAHKLISEELELEHIRCRNITAIDFFSFSITNCFCLALSMIRIGG